MTYRSADTAMRERIDLLEAEIQALDAEIAARNAAVAVLVSETSHLEGRLEREGPGGGREGARVLRIPLLVTTMLAVGAAVLPFQVYLAAYLRRSPDEVIPAYVIACGPSAIAYGVASSHRVQLTAARVLAGLVALVFVLGAMGVLRD